MRSGFLALLIFPSLLAAQITPGSKQAAQNAAVSPSATYFCLALAATLGYQSCP
jgi:hypothetical protein